MLLSLSESHPPLVSLDTDCVFSRSSSISLEALIAIALVFPFILIDTSYSSFSHVSSVLGESNPYDENNMSALQQTVLVTFMTLLMASAMVYYNNSSLKRTEGTKEPMRRWRIDQETVQEACKKAICVGLPIFASFRLGGAHIALLFLISSAAGLMPLDHRVSNLDKLEGWKRLISSKPLVALIVSMILFVTTAVLQSISLTSLTGCASALLSLFIVNPPFRRPLVPITSMISPPSSKSTSAVSSSPLNTTLQLTTASTVSPLVNTSRAESTVLAALISGATLLLISFFNGQVWPELQSTGIALGIALAYFLNLVNCPPHVQRSVSKIGLFAGSASIALFGFATGASNYHTIFLVVAAVASYFGIQIDERRASSSSHSHSHDHNTVHSHAAEDRKSRVTLFLLHLAEDVPGLHTMLADKNSRGIFYFMLLNFTFMIVQATYALLTDSLGLMSDSIHMFFDCLALAFGLFAAVLSKRPPSARFPYGFGKMDSLAGFGNGIFLL